MFEVTYTGIAIRISPESPFPRAWQGSQRFKDVAEIGQWLLNEATVNHVITVVEIRKI